MTSIELIGAKVDQIADTQLETQQAIEKIDLSIRGDGLNEPGLASRVADLEKFSTEIRRLIRFIVLGVIGLFGNLAWEVFQAYAKSGG